MLGGCRIEHAADPSRVRRSCGALVAVPAGLALAGATAPERRLDGVRQYEAVTGEHATVEVRSGPWDLAEIEKYLRSIVIPIRLASSGSEWPLVQSLWFLYDDQALWCCTQTDALVVERLRADPRCAFEVAGDAPPYRGVRGHGVASLHADRAAVVLERLIERYLGGDESSLARWLRSRLSSEVAIRIGELSVTSWDYSPRMRSPSE